MGHRVSLDWAMVQDSPDEKGLIILVLHNLVLKPDEALSTSPCNSEIFASNIPRRPCAMSPLSNVFLEDAHDILLAMLASDMWQYSLGMVSKMSAILISLLLKLPLEPKGYRQLPP